ncbi:MAG: DNA repair protein RadC [Vicinamibacterales bacterium]
MRQPSTSLRAIPPTALSASPRVDKPERRSISYHEGSGSPMAGLAVTDRPREKLARAGVQALGDNELVALLLGSGTRARGSLVVAQDVLTAAGGVQGLVRVERDELRRIIGVGESKAARILAAVELGRRTLVAEAGRRLRLMTPKAAAEFLGPQFASHRLERFGVLLLDAKHQVIRTEILSVGSLESTLADPREVFRTAMLASAANVVAFHNHPTGDPSPSPDDRAITARLRAAGELMGIHLADHIILADGGYFSFREEAEAERRRR